MAIFTLEDNTEGNGVELFFTADGPARFELSVDDEGRVHLFGYSGIEPDTHQDPNLVFDTDGSNAVFTDEEA